MNTLKLCLAACAALLGATGCGGGGGTGMATPEPPLAGSDPFVFQTFDKAAYAQIDRMGQPVVATVLLKTANKDQFNQTAPAEDADYASLMLERLRELHTGLDDALIAAGITPCAVDVCSRQVVNMIIPDTLQFDLNKPDGFPNGRRFEDITVDRILSLALTDMTTPGDCNGRPCTVQSFELLPTNPTRNESPFLAQFPYLAAAHPPP